MPKYSGMQAGITPVVNVANWVLENVANYITKIIEVSFGGEVTTSTAMRTRIARDSAIGTGTRTAGSSQRLDNPLGGFTQQTFFSTTYGTTQPTVSAGALFGVGWNAHGGVVRWLAAPGEEFVLVNSGSIEARQDLGTAQSSYSLIWEEQ